MPLTTTDPAHGHDDCLRQVLPGIGETGRTEEIVAILETSRP